MCLDPRRADSIIVQRVVNEEFVGVRLIDDLLHVVQAEGAGLLAVTRTARTPIAAERLFLEELLAVELDTKLVLTKPL
jgi:hypothetical protein